MSKTAERSPGAKLGSLALAMVVLTSCSDGTNPTALRVTSVRISQSELSLQSLGEQATVTATVSGPNGATVAAPVAWTSLDPSVATVSASGLVRAVSNGATQLVARADAVADSLEVTVAQVPVSIEWDSPDTLFSLGVPLRLPVVTDALGAPYVRTPLEWTVDDSSVASLSPDRLTPLQQGDVRLGLQVLGLTEEWRITTLDRIPVDVPIELATAFQWAMEDTAAQNGVIGASAAVMIPGVGTWRGVTGRSDETSVLDPDMTFYPGSIVKMIVSGVVLALVDDGMLALDDSLGTWIEPFENPDVSLSVSLRQVLQNTSGLFSYTTHPQIGDSLFADPNRVWDPRETLERFVGPPDFPPGTAWKSSNTGYILAGMAAEATTGRTIADLHRDLLFEPLGMAQAWVAGFEDPAAPVAATWRGPAGGPLVSSSDLTTTAAHTMLWPQPVISTPDLLALGTALFTDFLSPTLRGEMLAAVPDDDGIPGQVAGGLGIRQYDYLGRTQWGHSGSQGTGSGFFVWDEQSGIAVAILHNQNGASHRGSHFRLVPALLAMALEAQQGGP